MKNCFLFSIFLIIALSSQGQRVYSNDFLNIGVGGRAFGMSGSTVASVSDVTAGYWNPAGLVRSPKKMDFGIMHSEYFGGLSRYDYMGGKYKVSDSSALGLSFIRFGVDDIQNTLEIFDNEGNVDFDRIKYFSAADYAFIFSYSRISPIKGLNYGANAKVIYRKIGKFASAWGFGFDVGAQYQPGKWLFGAMLRDASSTFNAWFFNNDALEINIGDSVFNSIEDNALELTLPRLNIGIARNFSLNQDFKLLMEFNGNMSFDGEKHELFSNKFASIDPHFGCELEYRGFLFFRAGIGNFQEVVDFGTKEWTYEPNLGLGIVYKRFNLDYALTDIGDQAIAEYSNIFSIRYSIQ